MTRIIATLVSSVLVAGCMQTVVDTSCSSFKPITYSAAHDSEGTKSQIRGHNAAWDRLCR